MDLHPAVLARLERLAPDQRAAATAEPGPILCVAPAGSGKTTTLVARVAWLVDGGLDPATITVITFNRRAAEELRARVDPALEPLGIEPDRVRIRTFHALGREILAEAGVDVATIADRAATIRRILPDASAATRRRLDDAFSRLKLDLGVRAEEIAGDPEAGPIARAFVAYEAALAADGAIDFDDLVVRALAALEGEPQLLEAWRRRCEHLLVDEVQDVDRSQLRLALLLAAPGNRVFLVGDDDQSIYGWRLADVRRVLDLDGALPGLRRVDLITNYRCPAPVVDRAVRLVAHNSERFAKEVRARPDAPGRLLLAPDDGEEIDRVVRILDAWPTDGTRAFLARTNRELLPALAVLLERNIPFRADRLVTPLEDPRLDGFLVAAATTDPDLPLLIRLARVAPGAIDRAEPPTAAPDDGDEEGLSAGRLAATIRAWAIPFRDLDAFALAVIERRARLAALRSDEATLTLATAHATKGLEFDHVAVLGMEAGRFPSARSVGDAAEPARALEEERRLAYVAWTRARGTLTLSFDPAVASPFLAEAFDAAELAAG